MNSLPCYLRALVLTCVLVSAAKTQVVPPTDARESDWIHYIASSWKKSHSVTTAQEEYLLAEDSRVDIAAKHLIRNRLVFMVWEVERASKWKEAIGQAAFYQGMTGAEEAGIVLVCLQNEADKLFVLRCQIACQRCNIRLVTVDENGYINGTPE